MHINAMDLARKTANSAQQMGMNQRVYDGRFEVNLMKAVINSFKTFNGMNFV